MSDDADANATEAGSGHLSIREPPKVLIPLEVLEGQTIPESLVGFLAPSEVVILGYHVLPEQTSTEQASMQFEDRAREAVEAVAESFEEAGRTVDTRVAFTHDRDQTIERVAEDVGATAILLTNPAGDIEDVLVPIRGVIDLDRLADLATTLLAAGDRHVTLWGLNTDDFAADDAVGAAAERLHARGLPAERVSREVTNSESPVRDIVERSAEFDVIVMGEGGDSPLSMLLGEDEDRVAEGSVAPVLVVRDRVADE